MSSPIAAATPDAAAATEVNMADVARAAGVSIATVSRALRGVSGVSPATRERIRAVADDLAYVVSPEASRLSRGETGRIAVVVPRVDVWFYATMLAGIEVVLRESDVDVIVYQVDGETQRRHFFATLPSRRKVDAVILVALPMTQAEEDRFGHFGAHVVVAGGRVSGHPHVEVDDYALARTAVRHLLSLGHTRIAMLRTSDTDLTAWSADEHRVRGYRAELEAAGLPARPDYLVTRPAGATAGVEGMAALLELTDPPTAVFAFSDELAVGALATLVARGVRVPQDMSLVGADGHPLTEVFGLTTVTQSVEVQGRLVAAMTLGLIRKDRAQHTEIVVPTELVVRGSTGPPRLGPLPG